MQAALGMRQCPGQTRNQSDTGAFLSDIWFRDQLIEVETE